MEVSESEIDRQGGEKPGTERTTALDFLIRRHGHF
jgi:hypothetical protein